MSDSPSPKLRVATPPEKPGPGYEPAKSLANYEAKSAEWLWWPWIPLDKISILEGEPDVGKSTITLDIATRVSLGRSFPQTTIDGRPDSRTVDKCKLINTPSNVLLVGVEDGIEDTVVPRLLASGANLSRVYTKGIKRDENGVPEPLTIPKDMDLLERDIKTSNAKLVVIDPYTAFLSENVKANDMSSNQKALNYLGEIAERLHCAILLIRHHNKASGMSAKNRGSGSVGIVGTVRSTFLANKSTDEDGNRVYTLADVKCNLAPDKDSIIYELEPSPLNEDVPIIKWGSTISKTADELVQSETIVKERESSKAKLAANMIEQLLQTGPQLAEYMLTQVSKEVGTTTRTVNRAAEKLGVHKEQVRDKGGALAYWVWSMSPSSSQVSTPRSDRGHSA